MVKAKVSDVFKIKNNEMLHINHVSYDSIHSLLGFQIQTLHYIPRVEFCTVWRKKSYLFKFQNRKEWNLYITFSRLWQCGTVSRGIHDTCEFHTEHTKIFMFFLRHPAACHWVFMNFSGRNFTDFVVFHFPG